MENGEGPKPTEIEFLKRTRPEVVRAINRDEKSKTSSRDRIGAWLAQIEKKDIDFRNNPEDLQKLKERYYKENVITPDQIPDSYFENQRRLAREEGYGDIVITPQMRQEQTEIIITDQKSSLDKWIGYFVSPDTDIYPMWEKVWAFQGMLKLSIYDKEEKAFAIRRKDTVAPFPDLNREALSFVFNVIDKKVKQENIPDAENNPELQNLLEGENFGKLYSFAIEKVTPTNKEELSITEGVWVKYPKGSDHMPLVNSLQEKGTGWCTSSESTAEKQLAMGDFYVYYSNDKNGKPTIPRAAIRMQGDKIGEVRGIEHKQNLDPYINNIVDTKLDEFPDKEKFKKKTEDMKILTHIDKKQKNGEALSKEDLSFLYEIGSKIEGFGYEKDPRIEEIKRKREIKSDLSLLTGYPKEQISLTREEALKGGIKYHYGDLTIHADTDIGEGEKIRLPEDMIEGGLEIFNLRSAEGLTFPKKAINGNICLYDLESAENMILPREVVKGTIGLNNVKFAKGLKFPKEVGGSVHLMGLRSAEDVEFPIKIGGILKFAFLESVSGLILPEEIGSDLYLGNYKSPPESALSRLTKKYLLKRESESAKVLNLKFPEVKGAIYVALDPGDKEKLNKKCPELRIG